MIILNPKKINTNFKNIIETYNNSINLPYMECPTCFATNLIKWGSYDRNINFIAQNKIMYTIIKIQRVKCNDCGHTHALLPSCIVPYKISNLDLILSCIHGADITLNFSFDTIEKWKKEFYMFLPYLKSIFHHVSTSLIISNVKHHIFYYYDVFYRFSKKILMMTHAGIVGMAYF